MFGRACVVEVKAQHTAWMAFYISEASLLFSGLRTFPEAHTRLVPITNLGLHEFF